MDPLVESRFLTPLIVNIELNCTHSSNRICVNESELLVTIDEWMDKMKECMLKQVSFLLPYSRADIEYHYKRQIYSLLDSLNGDQICRNVEVEKRMMLATRLKDFYSLLLQYVYSSNEKCHLYQPSFTLFEVSATYKRTKR